MAVTWSYDGVSTLTATCTGLDPLTSYDLYCSDPGSSGDSQTSDGSGALVLGVTDIGGASAGETYEAEVLFTASSEPIAAIVFKIGTASASDQGIVATWSYDGGGGGTGVVSVTFDTIAAITYTLDVAGDFAGEVSVVGDGTSKVLTYSTLDYGSVTSFEAVIYHAAAHSLTDSVRLFEPGVAGAGSQDLTPQPLAGRVFIAFDDGPLVANPTWTRIDGGDSPFPDQFVAGYDTKNGRQSLISQTETGTATVYCNDRSGLFDDRNLSSPYIGNLSSRQILLQLWNPVTEAWEPQFRGIIDDYSYDIDGSAVDADGAPINASVQLECVDIFDYLNGYGLTPGLDGHPPPAGMEDGVWYDATSGSVQDRFLAILYDANIDAQRYHLASGTVNVIGVKYDPDESALTALRDAADAELPFIANIYVDRYGRFMFRGKYSRFDPDFVSSEPGSSWDFQRWPVGDGAAIEADPTRGQIREVRYVRSRADLINAAIAYPQGIDAADMPGQVTAASASILAHGKHQAPPMSDLLTSEGTFTGYNKLVETAKFAELLVENKKAPRVAITALQLKSLPPEDPRAAATWGTICGADISHIVNVAVGYPGGAGLSGGSPADDHYIEGRSLTVRPLNPVHDYVECDLEVSPALWSMDANGVFPNIT